MRFVNYCIPFLFTICSVPIFWESGLYVLSPKPTRSILMWSHEYLYNFFILQIPLLAIA